MNPKYRERFVEDFQLPILICEDPYFDYYIELYDKILNTKALNMLYEQTSKKYNGDKKFYDYYNSTSKRIRKHLDGTHAFENFNNMRTKTSKISVKTTKLYESKNNQKLYYSLDLKQANFQALKTFEANLVLNENTFDDFIRRFTDEEYIIKSRRFRFQILNNLSKKNVLNIERYFK